MPPPPLSSSRPSAAECDRRGDQEEPAAKSASTARNASINVTVTPPEQQMGVCGDVLLQKTENCCCYEDVILITGGAGFIGSHVAQCVHDTRPNSFVVVLDKLDYCATLKNLRPLLHSVRFKFIEGDVCDLPTLTEVMDHHRVSVLLHFAAQSHVDNSFGSTLSFTKANVLGTHCILEACRLAGKGLRKIIHVSTDEVYGSTTTPAKEEATMLRPSNPYAASKAAAEMLVLAYRQTFNLPIIITRGNNVYGPRQYPEKLIPKFILRSFLGRTLPVHGTGAQLRSYVYVTDAAKAYNMLIDKGVPSATYNIGTRDEISVSQVAQDIATIITPGDKGTIASTHIRFVEDRLAQDHQYALDSSEINALGWQPSVTWNDGLARTIAWYKEHTDYWGDVEAALEAHTSLPVNERLKLGTVSSTRSSRPPSPTSTSTSTACSSSADVTTSLSLACCSPRSSSPPVPPLQPLIPQPNRHFHTIEEK